MDIENAGTGGGPGFKHHRADRGLRIGSALRTRLGRPEDMVRPVFGTGSTAPAWGSYASRPAQSYRSSSR